MKSTQSIDRYKQPLKCWHLGFINKSQFSKACKYVHDLYRFEAELKN